MPRLVRVGSRLSLYIALTNVVPRAVVSGVSSGNFLRKTLSVHANKDEVNAIERSGFMYQYEAATVLS